MRKIFIVLLLTYTMLIAGCASVPIQRASVTAYAKQFNPPPQGKAGLYIYRDRVLGSALKKDIWVNGKCVGESASGVFFYYEVPADDEYTIATESEFSPNEIKVTVGNGINYFIHQFIKLGVFVGGADLELVEPEIAKIEILSLQMAINGKCDKQIFIE